MTKNGLIAVLFAGLTAGGFYGSWMVDKVNRGIGQDATSAPLPPAPTALEVVRMGSFFTAIDYAPMFVAQEKEWFDEELGHDGAKAEYTEFQTLPSITEAFASDMVDVVFEAEPPAIIARAASVDVRIVGISCSLRQEIIVPTTSSVKQIRDLGGKKVAVLAGTSSHYGVLKIAAAAGLRPGAIQIVDMVPPNAKAAFARGEVDAWAVWPPWVEEELVAGAARTVPASEAYIHSVVVAHGKFVDGRPRRAEAVVRAVERARAWMREHPEEAQALVAKRLGIDPKVVALAWPKHDWTTMLSAAVIEDIQDKSDFLTEAGSIKNRVDATQLVKPLQPKAP